MKKNIDLDNKEFKIYSANELYSSIDRISNNIYNAYKNNIIYSVMICDINNLKLINDILGHQIGDENINLIIKIITSSIRTQSDRKDLAFMSDEINTNIYDMLDKDEIIDGKVCISIDRLNNILNDRLRIVGDNNSAFRIGGDEFLIILKGCNSLDALNVRKRITDSIQLNKINNKKFVSSLAIGISDSSEIKEDYINGIELFKKMVELADKSMYQDKMIQKRNLSEGDKEFVLLSYINRMLDTVGYTDLGEEKAIEMLDYCKEIIRKKK